MCAPARWAASATGWRSSSPSTPRCSAISCDPVYALRAFADSDGLNFPLLSDFWPHGEVTRAYAVFDESRGCPMRSSYVIDKEGVVRWAVHNEGSQERDLGEHLAQLEALA